jgi:hypothetical protein
VALIVQACFGGTWEPIVNRWCAGHPVRFSF